MTRLDNANIHNGLKVQAPSAPKGLFSKDRFQVDLDQQTVTCPAGHTTAIRAVVGKLRAGLAEFGDACHHCPLATQPTTAAGGRSISISNYETALIAGRARQHDPVWKADYQATRPKVERKIGHLMHRRHGGRRARVRGLVKVAADLNLLAAAVNLARLGVLGLTHHNGRWTTTPA